MANKKGMNPVEAGIIGAAAGLAVGAAAVALSSEENRNKIGEEINKLEKEGKKTLSDIQGKVGDAVSEGQQKVAVVQKDLKK